MQSVQHELFGYAGLPEIAQVAEQSQGSELSLHQQALPDFALPAAFAASRRRKRNLPGIRSGELVGCQRGRIEVLREGVEYLDPF